MDYSEKWGKNVDEAVNLALADLKLTIDEVEVTVLEEGSTGFLGFGSKLAKVRVEKKTAETIKKEKEIKKAAEKQNQEKAKPEKNTAKAEKAAEKTEKAIEKAERKESAKQKKHEKINTERPENLVEATEHPALNFINELADKMDLELEIKAMKNDDCIYIDIEGKDSGTIIGKRGQTLDAIQYLTSLVANKEKENYLRVVVDAENYRRKREQTLEQLADRLAGKVMRTKKTVKLEPMNPYERKVIHARLQGNSKINTRSEGEEPYRRVVIESK